MGLWLVWVTPTMTMTMATTMALVLPWQQMAPRHRRDIALRRVRRKTSLEAIRLDSPLVTRASTDWSPLAAVMTALATTAGALAAVVALGLLTRFVKKEEGDFQEKLRHFGKLRWGEARAIFESLRTWWVGVVDGEDRIVTLPESWAPSLLEDREDHGDYVTYRFALKAGPNCALPLKLGQEVTLMCLDDKNRPVRASFPLASKRRDPAGVVAVMVPIGARRLDRAAVGGLTGEQMTVAAALDNLPVGGEVAVRPGRQAFNYDGPHLPITSLQCFVEELGAIPAIQLIQESLPRGQSTVGAIDVFYMNAHEEDFVLYDKLESLYYKFHRKMSLSCVLDEQLYQGVVDDSQQQQQRAPRRRNQQQNAATTVFKRNDDLRQAVNPWEPGLLAVIAGPPAFATQVSTYLKDVLKYPPDCVIAL